MVEAHEVDVATETFNQIVTDRCIVLETGTITTQDYILFRETDSNRFVMTQVKRIGSNTGLSEGYSLLMLTTL